MSKSSSFPFGPVMASTWNTELLYRVGAAFGQEALAGLGLRTSKQGDYARPLPKQYVGWAAPLGW